MIWGNLFAKPELLEKLPPKFVPKPANLKTAAPDEYKRPLIYAQVIVDEHGRPVSYRQLEHQLDCQEKYARTCDLFQTIREAAKGRRGGIANQIIKLSRRQLDQESQDYAAIIDNVVQLDEDDEYDPTTLANGNRRYVQNLNDLRNVESYIKHWRGVLDIARRTVAPGVSLTILPNAVISSFPL